MARRALPDRCIQALAGVVLAASAIALVGCAASGEPRDASPSLQSAERVARMLTGSYAGISRQADSGARESSALVRLEARVERIAAGGAEVRLEQREGEGQLRVFAVVFRPTAIATRLEGVFSPLGPDGLALGSCPIEVSVQSDGFVARTSPETCRFGDADGSASLIKEIAHDGQRLVIGDRIVDPETGDARAPDRILELERVRRFVGWAGVRDAGGSWRVDERLELASDGEPLDPEDAGGMPLGIALDLAPHRVREGRPPVLRLRVFDLESGDLLGQSWADAQAAQIGLALPAVQIGLRLPDSR